MKEFFVDMWQMLVEPIDGFLDGVMRFLLAAAFIGIAFLILWGTYLLIDSTFRAKSEGTGNITGKDFTPAHTTITFINTGKSLIPISHYHPDNWSVAIEVDGKYDWVDVSQEYYNWATVGRKVNVIYYTGRFSGDVYIKRILN